MLVLPKLGRHFDRTKEADRDTVGFIMIDLEERYGDAWLVGGLVEYINNAFEYCTCVDDAQLVCVRCSIRECLGLPYTPAVRGRI